MTVGFFFREALRSMKRNAVPSFAAMAAVVVTVLVLGVFIPVVQATTGAANEVRSRVLVDVYLKTRATDADIERVRRLLTEDTQHVKSVEFVSKATAYAQERKRNPEAYSLLGSNPLPDTFRVTPDNPDNIGAILDSLAPRNGAGHREVVDQSIDIVRNRKDETNKILTATRVVKLSMGLLALLLVIASILLISNTIRLSIFSRRREIEVMKLVGATNWFVRGPFMLEGLICGVAGALLAIFFLVLGKAVALPAILPHLSGDADVHAMAFPLVALVLLASGLGLGAVGSGLTIRRFLRV
jgi:cell division transport system permease protein